MGCDFYLYQIVPIQDSKLTADFNELVEFCDQKHYQDVIIESDWLAPPERIQKHLLKMAVPYVEYDLIKRKHQIPSHFQCVSEGWDGGKFIYIFSPPESEEYKEVEILESDINKYVVHYERFVLICKELEYLGRIPYTDNDFFKRGKHPFFDQYNFQFFHTSVQSCLSIVSDLVTEVPKHIEESIKGCEDTLQKDSLSFIFISA